MIQKFKKSDINLVACTDSILTFESLPLCKVSVFSLIHAVQMLYIKLMHISIMYLKLNADGNEYFNYNYVCRSVCYFSFKYLFEVLFPFPNRGYKSLCSSAVIKLESGRGNDQERKLNERSL